jgi:hypothetical protein
LRARQHKLGSRSHFTLPVRKISSKKDASFALLAKHPEIPSFIYRARMM